MKHVRDESEIKNIDWWLILKIDDDKHDDNHKSNQSDWAKSIVSTD